MNHHKGVIMLALFIIYITLTATGLFLMKAGSESSTFAFRDSIFNVSISLKMLFGLILYICSFLLFIFLLGRFDLSHLFPMASSMIIVMTSIIGYAFLGEQMTKFSVIGIALIVAGVTLMNFKL